MAKVLFQSKLAGILLGCLLLLSACFNKYPKTSIELSEQQIVVFFTRTATEQLLDSIKTVCQSKGVQLEYSSIKKDGKLLNELEFIVQYQHRRGMAKTNFVNLRSKHFGFEIEFRPDGKFKIGDL